MTSKKQVKKSKRKFERTDRKWIQEFNEKESVFKKKYKLNNK
jgi:hypothetical protein